MKRDRHKKMCLLFESTNKIRKNKKYVLQILCDQFYSQTLLQFINRQNAGVVDHGIYKPPQNDFHCQRLLTTRVDTPTCLFNNINVT